MAPCPICGSDVDSWPSEIRFDGQPVHSTHYSPHSDPETRRACLLSDREVIETIER